MKILIVDDERLERLLVRRLVLEQDRLCDVVEASTSNEALCLCAEQSFDVALIDYRMPGVNGIELVEKLRQRESCSQMAIVIMSCDNDEDLVKSCIQSGAHDFVWKSQIDALSINRALLNAQSRLNLERELEESNKKVKHLAEQDSLTGLANRFYFQEALRSALDRHDENEKKSLALLTVDIDHFKYFNESFGHDLGDALLLKVVTRIRSCLRGSEIFARLGGDEFGIVLEGLQDRVNASQVAQRILHVLKKPFDMEGCSASVSVSIGISVYPENGNEAQALIKSADIAMYRAKKLGRGQFCYFQEEMQEKFAERFRTERSLRNALLQKSFELHYQPIIDGSTDTTRGYEALLRCRFDNELVPPNVFIPVAEESRLIVDIGRWVIEEAIAQIARWNNDSADPLSMAINLSPVQFQDAGLPEFIESCLDSRGVDPRQVYLELTETALLDPSPENIAMIERIGKLGCRIALDDFGTGFSSITHLMKFPISTVKIDRSLMPSCDDTSKQSLLLRGLISMLKHLKLEIVGEGIETRIQKSLCHELQVDKLQGFHYSRPLTAKEIEKSAYSPLGRNTVLMKKSARPAPTRASIVRHSK